MTKAIDTITGETLEHENLQAVRQLFRAKLPECTVDCPDRGKDGECMHYYDLIDEQGNVRQVTRTYCQILFY